MELTIDKPTARQRYQESPDWLKQKFEEAYGKKYFAEKSFYDIKTFDDACKYQGTSAEEFNKKFSTLGLDADTINYEKLKIVVKAINQGCIPDYSNLNQYKWWPWFRLVGAAAYYGSSAGLAFSYSYYAPSSANAYFGSRLCFESEEKSDYAAKQFFEIYQGWLL